MPRTRGVSFMKHFKVSLEEALSQEDYERVESLLEDLKDMDCTKEDLEATKIGAVVNRIRKMDQPRLGELATSILLQWKDIMLSEKRVEPKEGSARESAKRVLHEGDESVGMIGGGEVEGKKMRREEETKTVPSLNLPPVRAKCVEMLCNAMRGEGEDLDDLTLDIAQQVEAALFSEFKNTEAPYKSKFRSKYLNLKDKQNGALREGLRSGFITPERFIAMTSAVRMFINFLIGNGQ